MVDVLFDKEFNCMNCEKRFKSKKVRQSKIIVKSKDTDFCTYYEGVNPYYYEIRVCPHCGFAFSDNYSPLKNEKKAVLRREYLDKIKVGNFQLCGPRSLEDALLSYKLALLCANFIEESKVNIAGICMRIAWLYRYTGNQEEERIYLAKALALYESIYQTEDVASLNMGKYKLLYLIGELHGRLGHYQEARKWFNPLLYDRGVEPVLHKMVRERWDEFRGCLENKSQAVNDAP